MNDELEDGVIRAAMAFQRWPEPSDDVREAFRNLPRAPLSNLIDRYFEQGATSALETSLRAIAALNEGDLADLDDPRFRSFIVSMTSVPYDAIEKCALILRAYRLRCGDGRESRFAARDDE